MTSEMNSRQAEDKIATNK